MEEQNKKENTIDTPRSSFKDHLGCISDTIVDDVGNIKEDCPFVPISEKMPKSPAEEAKEDLGIDEYPPQIKED